MLSDAKDTREKASLRPEGESLLLDSSKRSEDKDEDEYGTGAKDNNCDGNGAGDSDKGGDRNTGAGGRSTE